MRLCAISFKECWQDEAGNWLSYGGFPIQMAAVGSLFDEMTLVIVRVQPREGGLPLPSHARIVALHRPHGEDARRKLSVGAQLPYYVGTIARHIRQADVVHVPLPGDIPFLGMLIALFSGKHLIARYGGSWATTSETTMMNRITWACMRRFAGGRNVMIATGEGKAPPAPRMEWVFATALTASEVRCIHPLIQRSLSAPSRLIYAGRLAEEKGVAYLIKALALLNQEQFPQLPRLILAGDGPERKALESLITNLGCEHLVTFVGQLTRNELSAHFGQADVCVQPSLTEGFSKAWLDAMAHGLPVLTSSVGAARDVIGAHEERGWLVPPGDVEALATALRHVLAAPIDWPALRQRCRTYVEGRTIEAWTECIGQICARQWNMSLVEGQLRA